MNGELKDRIDVDAIMREIRAEILAEKGRLSNVSGQRLNIDGKRLPPDFYDKLYQAGVGYSDMTVRLNVSKSETPIIGPLIDRLRGMIHNLVLFYVNMLAAEQGSFNRLMVDLVNHISLELEEDVEQTGDDERRS